MSTLTSSSIDLNPHDLKEVLQVLDLYLPGVEVHAFGSRVKWTAKPYSDLDLALMTDDPLSLEQAALLREAFDETTLPFKVDFVDWASTSDSFRRIIQATSVVFRPARTSIADDLTVLSLDEALEALLDYRGKTPTKTTSGIPLVTAKIVKNGRIETPTEFIALEDYSAWMTRGLPKAGDVVLTTEAPLGEVAQLSTAHVALAQRIVVLRGKPGVLDNTYLRYLLQTAEMQEQLAARATGTTVVGIKQSELRKIAMRLPPIGRQRAVATVLSSLDDKIELKRRMNKTLEAMARAIFQSWFVDFDPVRAKTSGESAESICQRLGLTPELLALFPDSFEDSEIGEIPAGWEVTNLSEFCELNARSWSTKTLPDEVHYVDLANTKNGVIQEVQTLAKSDAPSRAKRILRPGDTAVGTVRPGNRSFALIGSRDVQLTGSTGFAVLSPSESYVTEIVYFVATSDDNIDRLARLADGGAYPAVSPEIILATRCVRPKAEIFKAFHEVSSSLMSAFEANTLANIALANTRDELLPKLLSGELGMPEE